MIAPNMTTPPRVGILHLCIFLSSDGVSTKFLSLATLIKEGIENNTTRNEVINPKTTMYKPFIINYY